MTEQINHRDKNRNKILAGFSLISELFYAKTMVGLYKLSVKQGAKTIIGDKLVGILVFACFMVGIYFFCKGMVDYILDSEKWEKNTVFFFSFICLCCSYVYICAFDHISSLIPWIIGAAAWFNIVFLFSNFIFKSYINQKSEDKFAILLAIIAIVISLASFF